MILENGLFFIPLSSSKAKAIFVYTEKQTEC